MRCKDSWGCAAGLLFSSCIDRLCQESSSDTMQLSAEHWMAPCERRLSCTQAACVTKSQTAGVRWLEYWGMLGRPGSRVEWGGSWRGHAASWPPVDSSAACVPCRCGCCWLWLHLPPCAAAQHLCCMVGSLLSMIKTAPGAERSLMSWPLQTAMPDSAHAFPASMAGHSRVTHPSPKICTSRPIASQGDLTDSNTKR